MITIEVLQSGTIQETFIVTEQEDGVIYPISFDNQQIGEIEIATFNYFCGLPEDNTEVSFRVISRKDNNYTKFNGGSHLDTLRIDYQLDFDAVDENLICGTMYDSLDGFIINASFSVWQDSVFIDSLFTDNIGRFETEIEPDNYLLKAVLMEESFETEFQLMDEYADYYFDYYSTSYKPNIYIYPQTTINLNVNISFPKSGKVIKSIPEFPKQWQNLQIEPDGKINDKYDYLFYESIQPNIFQKTKGWVVKLENLTNFFKENLQQSGFNNREISDFIEHWIPILTDSKYYAVYPQYNKQLEPLIQLNFSQHPENILRLTYLIVRLDSNEIELTKPEIPSFERKGFVVTEWGLIFDKIK
ncbi:MAG: hypothetical protein HN952_05285 [Candidatus Cloacimonetes bacterium]|nr:hypothetical protein [Candidatus Cloacimonadota bacterium]MBT6994354.1 hypothetical protein [Candidatus Cloacimonadota bacterium]MBT7469948.1 hypothetical protein [Candidatus Cloacimonadota bacterium]